MPEALILILFACILLFFNWYVCDDVPFKGFELIGVHPGDWFNRKAKRDWEQNAAKIIRKGIEKTNGGPFQVMTGNGPVVMLPLSLSSEVANDPRLSFSGFIERQGLTKFPGLDVMHTGTQGDIIQEVCRKNLTQALGSLTDIISIEMSLVVDEYFPGGKDWQEMSFMSAAVQIAARLSARVLLGERLCHDARWIETSSRFAVVTLKAQQALRAWPVFMRPLVHRFLPVLLYQRALIAQARRIMQPELQARRATRFGVAKPLDSLSWLDDVRQGRKFDVVAGQLFLTVAAIHTTSTVLTGVVYDLVAHPEYIEELREEVVRVLKEDGGWKKTSLYNMKLMDSCLKESMRLNVLGSATVNRRVETPLTLSDGTHLPAGVYVSFPTLHMREGATYEHPDRFDGRRFARLRTQPGYEHKSQLVTATPDFLAFGLGKHSCPGRFFAATELKIALAHLLLRYDWRFVDGRVPRRSVMEARYVPDPETRVECRVRDVEVEVRKFLGY